MLTYQKIMNLPLPTGNARAKYADGSVPGLTLVVSKTGSKIWYVRLMISGKEHMIRIGKFPTVGIADARKQAEAIRDRVDKNLPPLDIKISFSDMATEWLTLQKARKNLSPAYCKDIMQRLEKHVFPSIGSMPLTQIQPAQILTILQKIALNGRKETAKRLCQYTSSIYRTAIALHYAQDNPAVNLWDQIPIPEKNHYPSVTDQNDIRKIFNTCLNYYGNVNVRNALIFLALTAARPGMVIRMEWSEWDKETHTWNVPADKMKAARAMKKRRQEFFSIPLTDVATAILEEQEKIRKSNYVFEGRQKGRPLSNNTLLVALHSMGITNHVPHGWRASFSTIAYESGLWRGEVIESALAHTDTSEVRAAYNHAQYIEERRKLMEWWSNLLCSNITEGKSISELNTQV